MKIELMKKIDIVPKFFIEEERALTNKQPSLFDINELMK